MQPTMIGPENDFALWAALLGPTAFAFRCERYSRGRRYTGMMLMMTLAIVLSNLRIIPTAAPVYDIVWEYLVPLSIALLLLQADLRKITREAGPVLIAFVVGGAAVVAGTAIAATADIWVLVEMAPILFVFAALIVAVHLAVLFGLGQLFRFDIAELVMASAVCIGVSVAELLK